MIGGFARFRNVRVLRNMAILGSLATAALRRDKACHACGTSTRPVLAAHHVVPMELGGKDNLSNLLVLCANCHRSVHWLATGDRSLHAHAYGLGPIAKARRRILGLARSIRRRRHRDIGANRTLASALPLSTAFDAVVSRNGFDADEGAVLRRCFRRAWRAIRSVDRRACSVRLVRGARFLSVNANNHLAVRVPAWTDDRHRETADIVLIWPQSTRLSIMSPQRFRRESSSRFRLIPHFNLWLTWDECLALTSADWRVFRDAVHDGLTVARSSRRTSNVVAD
jgi:hypothetical protein